MHIVSVISSTTDSFFNWTPDVNSPVTQYVLELEDTSGDIAYSQTFTIEPPGWTSGTTSGYSYSAQTSSFTSSITSVSQAYGPGCSLDSCLLAFDRTTGVPFCSSFTQGLNPAYPSYTTACAGTTLARLSSACTCLNYWNPAPTSASFCPA
jgi:hypothetical protein